MFLFSVEKGAPPVLYRDVYFKDCWHEVRSSLKCIPPPKKLRTRLNSDSKVEILNQLRCSKFELWFLDLSSDESTEDDIEKNFLVLQKQAELRNR